MDCLPSPADSNGKLFPETRIKSEVDRLGGCSRPVLRPVHLHSLSEHVELPLDVLEGREGSGVRVGRCWKGERVECGRGGRGENVQGWKGCGGEGAGMPLCGITLFDGYDIS